MSAASVLVAAGAAAAQPAARAFDALDYDVALRVDAEKRAVSGVSTVTFRALAGAEAFELSDNSLRIDRATLDGRPLKVARDGKRIRFEPERPLVQRKVSRLRLAYSGKPARGLTFTERAVYTGYFTCDWMFCDQDAPGDKATLTLRLDLPTRSHTVASGERRRRAVRAGRLIETWRETRPQGAYLFGFAAGDLISARLRHPNIDLRVLSESAPEADLARMFQDTGPMLDFFQAKAGLPFPGRRYTQVLTDKAEAQEVSSFSLVGRPYMDPILKTPQEDWLIAHELAHQWWGNLVTCATWDQMWLNEGVVTFMVAAWKEQRWGRAAYDREMDLARGRVAAAKKAGFDVPLTFAGPYPSLSVRRAVTYSKGALFLDVLREEMGEAAFWSGLRAFTRNHAGGAVTSPNFQAAMEKAAGRDLDALFEEWVY